MDFRYFQAYYSDLACVENAIQFGVKGFRLMLNNYSFSWYVNQRESYTFLPDVVFKTKLAFNACMFAMNTEV